MTEKYTLALVFKSSKDSQNTPIETDMSNFRQLADFRLFCLVLGHSCESSRSGLIFSSFFRGGGGCSGRSDYIISRIL